MFGVGVKPLKISLSVPIVSSLMILMSGSFNPCSIIVGLFVFIFAVGVAVAVVVPMFGTVVNHLVPFVSFAVFLHVAWQTSRSTLGASSKDLIVLPRSISISFLAPDAV